MKSCDIREPTVESRNKVFAYYLNMSFLMTRIDRSQSERTSVIYVNIFVIIFSESLALLISQGILVYHCNKACFLDSGVQLINVNIHGDLQPNWPL